MYKLMFSGKTMFASVNEFRQKTAPSSMKFHIFFPDTTAPSEPRPSH